ncbi:MAG: MBL fold metallo-hydrolase [Pseudomonadota bacterium]
MRLILYGSGFVLFVLACTALLMFPTVAAELYGLERRGKPKIADHPQQETLLDQYWSVSEVGSNIFAIGEPRYYQYNWSYLIVGSERALLFDTGAGLRDISTPIANLTDKPIHVVLSHFHFDHVGGVGAFDNILMLDIPSVRRHAKGDTLNMSRYQHLGFIDGQSDPRITVSRWFQHGESFDLGDRHLKLFSAPGHTPESVVVFDPGSDLLFTGDYFYEGNLYAFVPGSSRSSYLETAEMLLKHVSPQTRVYGAHAKSNSVSPPLLSITSLQSLRDQLEIAESGDQPYDGVLQRYLEIDESVGFITGPAWTNR